MLPVDGDLDGADADDTVAYVITVVNEGGWAAYNVTIAEDTPTGLSGCAVVLNGVQVNLVPTAAYSGDLFSTGLVLTNPLQPHDVLTIEYLCTIDSDVYPLQELVNTGQSHKLHLPPVSRVRRTSSRISRSTRTMPPSP